MRFDFLLVPVLGGYQKMKIIYQKGYSIENAQHDSLDTSQFYLIEHDNIGLDIEADVEYPGDSILYDLDNEFVRLYDKFRDLVFEDTDKYYSQKNLLPIFIQVAGYDSDSEIPAIIFEKLLRKSQDIPDLNKHLYLVDSQFMVGTMQNLFIGMNYDFINYFKKIIQVKGRTFDEADCIIYAMSGQVAEICSVLIGYFTKAYSILDMLTKTAYEMQQMTNDYSTYKKLKSSKILWGDKKKLTIDNSCGTVFEKDELITSIETLRNEFVHNGSWELNPKVFLKFINREIVERYVIFPDLQNGQLIKFNNRRHFFSEGIKVNDILPKMHINYLNKILNTLKLLNT